MDMTAHEKSWARNLPRPGEAPQSLACVLAVALSLFAIAPPAVAGIRVGATRVILDSARASAIVPVENPGTTTDLVEIWADNGNVGSTPDTANAPFVVQPALFPIKPGTTQDVSVLAVPAGKPLPTDRESIFYLNIKDVPPKPAAGPQAMSTVQFAIQTRLKLFYLPSKLAGGLATAGDKLTIAAQGAGIAVRNPTPYYVTLHDLEVAERPVAAAAGYMLAPFESKAFTTTSPVTPGAAVEFKTINKYGGLDPHVSKVAGQ